LVVAVALAVFMSPFASSSPDGLERVAADKGFETAVAEQPAWSLSPLGDYQFPGVADERLATAVAGLIGTVALFVLVLLVGRAFSRRRLPPADRSDAA
jgi:cobalt/nickel transport protein